MRHFPLMASAALLLALPAGQALAVTADEVWASWKAQAAATGTELSASSEKRDGNILSLSGVTTRQSDGNDRLITTAVASVTMTERDDGSVVVESAGKSEAVIATSDAAGEKPLARLEISQPGAVLIASGTVKEITYALTIPELTVDLTEAWDREGKKLDGDFTLTARDIAGHYLNSQVEGGGYSLDAEASSGPVTAKGDFSKPDGSKLTFSFDLAGGEGASKSFVLDPAQMADLAKALEAGFSLDTRSKTGALGFEVLFESPEGRGTWKGGAESTAFHTVLHKDRVDYGLSLAAASLAGDAPHAGFDAVELGFSDLSLGFNLPLTVAGAPSDFTVLTRLTDLTMSDSLWARFDPSAVLSRDPVSFVLDASGKGAWLFDMIAASGGGMTEIPKNPVRLETLDVKKLLLRAFGAEADATAALTFDNSDMVTFRGYPAPTGKINVNLAGISGLIDGLVQLGLIGSEQLTGLRMGLAIFAKPGAGEDQLVSEIEFRDKGLFINGQRIM